MNWKAPYLQTLLATIAGAILSGLLFWFGTPLWALPIPPIALGATTAWLRYRFDHNLSLEEKNVDALVAWGIAGALGLFLGTLFILLRFTDLLGPKNQPLQMDVLLLLSLGVLLPLGIYATMEQRRIRLIEARLPDLLNDLSDAQRSGMSMAAAVEYAQRSDYGPLSDHVKRLGDQMSWGIPFTNALKQFAERVNTKLIHQTVHLINEASRSGGNTTTILHRAGQDIRRQKALEKDRQSTMFTYVMVVWVVFFVYLLVLTVLDAQFLPHVLAAGNIGPTQFGNLDPPLTEPDIRFLYYISCLVQAAGTGAVLGALMDERPTIGLNHAAAMAVASWVSFRIILPLILG